MPVFISHRTADDRIAASVASRLQNIYGITCYVDDIDAELNSARGTAAASTLIVRRLNQCTNLLAIVSRNTHGSWWVPFEVGVARQAPRTITSFTELKDAELPEFLLEWPRLRGTNAITTFANLYRQQKDNLRATVLTEQRTRAEKTDAVERFHRQLRTNLGQ